MHADIALFTIQDRHGHERFDVLLQSTGRPRDVAPVLSSLGGHYKLENWNVGEVTVYLIDEISLCLSPWPGVRLIYNHIPTDIVWKYRLLPANVVSVSHRGRSVFTGTFSQFEAWANNQANFSREDLVKQVVQFYYNSGSCPGSLRAVRVEQANDGYIEGYDLTKDDLVNDGYRKYRLDKIVGEITVLNLQEPVCKQKN